MKELSDSLVACTGLVLAGGQSRRFGADKAAFQLDNKPMIDWVYALLDATCLQVLISTANKSSTFDLPAQHVVDVFENAGPLAGIHAGMVAAANPWLIVVPVDMPFVKQSLIKNIIKHCKSSVDAVIVRDKHGLQPLLAGYNKRTLPLLQNRLEQNQLAVTSFVERINAFFLELPDVQLTNINTPADMPSSKLQTDR